MCPHCRPGARVTTLDHCVQTRDSQTSHTACSDSAETHAHAHAQEQAATHRWSSNQVHSLTWSVRRAAEQHDPYLHMQQQLVPTTQNTLPLAKAPICRRTADAAANKQRTRTRPSAALSGGDCRASGCHNQQSHPVAAVAATQSHPLKRLSTPSYRRTAAIIAAPEVPSLLLENRVLCYYMVVPQIHSIHLHYCCIHLARLMLLRHQQAPWPGGAVGQQRGSTSQALSC